MTQNPEVEDRARALSSRILALARQHDHRSLLAILDDPETEGLLSLLPDELHRGARVHLEGALVWRRQRQAIAARRLTDARRALDHFDLALARSLLERLEGDQLAPEDVPRRDALLLEMESRLMEAERLKDAAESVVEEFEPKRPRWWPRRRR